MKGVRDMHMRALVQELTAQRELCSNMSDAYSLGGPAKNGEPRKSRWFRRQYIVKHKAGAVRGAGGQVWSSDGGNIP
jgi:hypothetical protein